MVAIITCISSSADVFGLTTPSSSSPPPSVTNLRNTTTCDFVCQKISDKLKSVLLLPNICGRSEAQLSSVTVSQGSAGYKSPVDI